MKLKKLVKVFACLIFGISGFIVYFSCDIGLGSAVDTEAPVIKITSPETSAVLKGNIEVKGSYQDDQKVSRLVINVVNVEKESAAITNDSATVNSNGSWNYLIYTQSSSSVPSGVSILSDGKYEIKAVGYDEAGHSSGESSRTIEIDTTAPVVALSKPATINYANASPYGRTIKIKGLISDDHSLAGMKVQLFKANSDGSIGEEIQLTKSEFTDFDPSDTSVTIAKFFKDDNIPDSSSDDYKLYDNWCKMYGTKESANWDKEVKYFALVTVTDKAGNASERTFLKSNLLSLVQTEAGISLEMADLKNILNGSYKGSLNGEKLENVKSILNGSFEPDSANNIQEYCTFDESMLVFSVNSKANPTYELSGNYSYNLNADTIADSFRSVEETGSLTFKVDMGLDDIAFRPKNLTVRILKLNSSFIPTECVELTSSKISKSNGSGNIADDDTATESGTYSISLSDIAEVAAASEELSQPFMEPGKCYRFEVGGTDDDDNYFIEKDDKNYGFYVSPSTIPCTVSFDQNKKYVSAASLKADPKITVKVEDKAGTSPITFNAYVKYYENSKEVKLFEKDFNDVETVSKSDSFTGREKNVEIPLSSLPADSVKNYTLAVKVVTQKSGAIETTDIFYLYVDNAAPNISFKNSELLNTCSATDAKISVYENASYYKIGSNEAEKSNYFWDESTEKYIVRGLWDDVQTSVDNSFTGSGGIKLYYSIDAADAESPANWQEFGAITDSDYSIQSSTSWEAEISLSESTGQGKKQLSFKAEDAVGNESSPITFKNITFDFAEPSLKYSGSTLQTYYKSGDNPLVTFISEDDYGVASISVDVYKGNDKLTSGDNTYKIELADVGADNIYGNKSKKTARISFPQPLTSANDGTYKIYATATDSAGRTKSKIAYNNNLVDNLSFIIDATKPLYDDENPLKVKNAAWVESQFYGSEALSLTATYNEEMSTLYYWIKTPDWTAPDGWEEPASSASLTDWAASYDSITVLEESFKSGANAITFTADFENNKGTKSNTIYIQGKDKAGNLSDVKSFVFNLDTTAPELENGFYQIGSEEFSASGGTINTNKKSEITLYGYAQDAQSGIQELVFKLGDTEITPVVTYAAPDSFSANSATGDDYAALNYQTYSVYSAAKTTTSIKAWKAVFKDGDADLTKVLSNLTKGNLTATVTNGANTSVTLRQAIINVDTTAPVVTNVALTMTQSEGASSAGESFTAYKKTSTEYYVNPEKGTLKLSGIATDNTGVKSVSLKIDKDGDESAVITPAMSGDKGDWYFEDIDLSGWSSATGATAKLTVIDEAGNEATEYKTISINFDTVAPKVPDLVLSETETVTGHLIDALGKDIYLRIGDDDNDDVTSSEDKDKKVGKKYSDGSFGNSTSIKIRGNIVDSISGLSKIYYKVFTSSQTASTQTAKNDLIKTVLADGKYITPLSQKETKRVFYNVAAADVNDKKKTFGGSQLADSLKDGYYKYYRDDIDSTFAETFTDFNVGNNYLVIVAVDNVGNAYLDSVSIKENNTDVEKVSASINVDIQAPAVSSDLTDIIYSNGSKIDGEASVTINGSVIDYPTTAGTFAGVNSMSMTIGSSTTEIPVTLKDNNTKWEATLNASDFASLSNTVYVYATATDNAGTTGNSSTPASVATVFVDKAAPAVEISKPTDKDTTASGIQVNGTISLGGKIKNEQHLTEDSDTGTMVLYYTTSSSLGASALTDNTVLSGTGSASSAWIKFKNAMHNSSWTFEEINTRELPDSYDGTNYSSTYIADGTPVYFTVAASDKAGNIGYASPLVVILDQDTDRPEITFSNLTLIGKNSSNEEGAMSDEYDVWAKTDTLYGTVTDDDGISSVYVIESETAPDENTVWGNSIYSNGAWEYKVSEDGYKVLWFKVVDSDGRPFISSASISSVDDSALLSTPKLKDKADTVNYYGYKTGSDITATTNVLNSAVYVQIDTNDPEIYQEVWYTFSSDVKDALLNADSTNMAAILSDPLGHSWKSINEISGTYIGGPGRVMYVMYKTRDANGISSSTETFGTVTGTKVYPETQSTPYSLTNTYYSQVVEFDISSIESSNSVSMTLNVTDRANRTYSGKYYFAIDNEAPTVEYRNRSDGDSVYGSVSVSVTGRTTENRIGVIDTLKFCITDSATAPAASNENWVEFTDYVNTASWSITFDGGDNVTSSESTTFHTKTLNNWMDTICDSGTSSENASKTLYLWVYAVDRLGNTGISSPESLQLEIITQGDKPAVSIAYPASGATVGNTIRLSGSSDISTDSVAAIWLQIDPSYDEATGFNTSGWASELTDLITNSDGSLKNVGYSIVAAADSEYLPAELVSGILTSGSVKNWNLPINTLNEFNSQVNGQNRVLAVRAYAVSKTNKKISNYAEVYFTVDPNSPSFSGYNGAENYLLTRVENGITKTMKYTSGMWISGEWLLTGSITHSSGILTLSKDSTSLVTDGVAITSFTDGTEITEYTNTKGEPGWNFKIPVGSSNAEAVGKTNFTLNAVDKSDNHNTASLTVNINYDNKAPSSFVVNGLSSTEVNTFRQSNSTFSLSGSIVEGGAESGFERNAFYFTRDLAVTSNGTCTTTRYLIDPMLAKGDTKKANFIALGTVNGSEFSPNSGIVYNSTDGLYWRSSSAASIANTNELTVTSVPDNVRPGGICKINNVVYRIKSIADKTINIDGEFEPESDLTVYFALAQVIDHTVTESGTTNVYENAYQSLTNDDGDWMVEGVTQNGTNYSWTASINSKNIYDGSVTLHFSYFDAAGNVAFTSYSGMVSNNAPRLAGVTIATDYDGDGAFTGSGETKSYWVGNTTVTTSTKAAKQVADEITVASANNTAYYTLKDKTEIRAEVIGGNGNLYYSYNIGTTLGADGNIKGNNSTALSLTGDDYNEYDTTADDSYMLTSDSYINSRTATIEIPLIYFDNYLGTGTGDGENNTHYIANSEVSSPTWFQYKIWDETDGKTVFTDSQHATMNIALAVKVHDNEDPVTTITPFYWNSSSDNSLYQNSNSNGHIELSGDLPSETFTETGTGLYDKDSKVSGKVVISGYASDNIRLGSLNISIPKSSVLTEATTVAVYNNGVWYDSSSAADSIPSGVTLTQGIMESDGWSFTVSSTADGAYNDERGHRVKWTLNYNSEKVTNKAATDVVITVQAVDKVKKTGNESYQMDVVPYITGVTTSLSPLKSNNPSVYSRTALGHYSVKSDETVTLTGFNLDGTSVSISSLSTSGNYDYSVNSIPALNNLNNNDSKGSYNGTVDLTANPTGVYLTYANYYNRQPNNDNNNLLTDDIYFDIWELHSDAAVPISGKIEQPVMKINPKTGQLGFAFVNGPLYFSMGGASDHGDTSYDYWMASFDFFTSVGFAYDSLGYSYGVAAGGDINSGAADKFQLMTSRWGHAGRFQHGSYSGLNYIDSSRPSSDSIRLESIAMTGTKTGGNTKNFDKQRIKSPSFATSVHGTGDTAVTNLYLAYYDALNDEIRFKAGDSDHFNGFDVTINETDKYYQITRFDNGGVKTENKFAHYNPTIAGKLNNDTYVTLYDKDKTTPINPGKVYKVQGAGDDGNDATNSWFRLEEVNIDAYKNNFNESLKSTDLGYYPAAQDLYDMDKTETYVRVCTISGKSLTSSFIDYDVSTGLYKYRHQTVSMLAGSTTGTGQNAGEYVSIGVIPGTTADNDVVVAVWYDATNRVLRYAYNTSPMTNRNGTTDGVGWTYATEPVFSSSDYGNNGEYCQLAVDANGGIHIAAYDGSHCDLLYAYLSSYDATPQTCVVDSNGIVGSNITIDVALDANGKAVPRIGYYATSCIRPKLAYLADASSQNPTGVSDDAFTGKWECSVIPTSSNVTLQSNQYNKMNVALWKDSSGVISRADSTAFSAYGNTSANNTYTNNSNGYDSVSYGFAYGNGSSNAIMGYAIKMDATTDHIETAQMR